MHKNLILLVLKTHSKTVLKLKKNDLITTLEGDYNDILLLERTLLNFLQHLSGIATSTNKAVLKLNNPNIKICDTRKTIPGFENLQNKQLKRAEVLTIVKAYQI